MNAKSIVGFLWGALETSLIFLICIFPPDTSSWTPFLILLLALSTVGLIAIFASWLYTNWDKE